MAVRASASPYWRERPSPPARVIKAIVLGGLVAVMLFPFLYVLSVSLSSQQDLQGANVALIPLHPTLGAPGFDGGKPAIPLGTADYGFGAIPSTIKDENKIVELLHIMEYIAAPFGSDEFNFIYYGIEGDMFNWVNGAPVRVTNGNQTWSNGLNYLCGTTEINYFYANQPGEAELMQQLQEQQIQSSIPDPTVGLYSPTWVAQGANLIKMQQDAYNGIVVGNQPMSDLDQVISDWKKGGGDQARKEFQQSLEKCKP